MNKNKLEAIKKLYELINWVNDNDGNVDAQDFADNCHEIYHFAWSDMEKPSYLEPGLQTLDLACCIIDRKEDFISLVSQHRNLPGGEYYQDVQEEWYDDEEEKAERAGMLYD